MKPLPLIASHLLVLLLAFFIFRSVAGKNSAAEPTTIPENPSSSADLSRDHHDRSNENPSLHNRPSAEYADAWQRLASKRLSRSERQRLQVELLKSWAEVDLHAALTAALQEPWHDISWRGAIEELLIKGFAEAFIDQSPEVWRMIENQELGVLESGLLRNVWMQALIKKDPQLLITHLPNFNGLALGQAIKFLAYSTNSNADAKVLWKAVADLNISDSESNILRDLAQATAGTHSIEELREHLAADNPSLQTIAATALAIRMAEEAPDKALASIADVPEHLRKDFTFDLLKHANENHPVIAATINQLIDDQHWDLIADPLVAQRVKLLAMAGDAAAMSDWAVQLPEKIEAKELIHRSVAIYARNDPDAAWDWLSDLPAGLWRDRAYAEFSQQSLWAHKNTDRSREALEQITDPQFKKEAQSWRKEWEQRTGWKPE